MNRRGTLMLALATLIVAAAAIFMSSDFGDNSADVGAGEPLFPDLRSQRGDIDQIRLSGPAGETTLLREQDVWVVQERGNYQADAAQVRAFLRSLGQVTRKELKTGDPERLARIGLGNGAVRVEASIAGDGIIAAFAVGSSVTRGADRERWTFVHRDGEERAWLVDALEAIDSDPSNWLDRQISDLSPARFSSVDVTPASGDGYRLSGDATFSGEITLEGLKEDEEMATLGLARATAAALSDLKFEDFALRGEISAPILTELVYRMADGLIVTAVLSEDAEARRWLNLHAAYDADRAADPDGPSQMPDAPADGAEEAEMLNARWGKWAYLLSAASVDNLVALRSDLVAATAAEE